MIRSRVSHPHFMRAVPVSCLLSPSQIYKCKPYKLQESKTSNETPKSPKSKSNYLCLRSSRSGEWDTKLTKLTRLPAKNILRLGPPIHSPPRVLEGPLPSFLSWSPSSWFHSFPFPSFSRRDLGGARTRLLPSGRRLILAPLTNVICHANLFCSVAHLSSHTSLNECSVCMLFHIVRHRAPDVIAQENADSFLFPWRGRVEPLGSRDTSYCHIGYGITYDCYLPVYRSLVQWGLFWFSRDDILKGKVGRCPRKKGV